LKEKLEIGRRMKMANIKRRKRCGFRFLAPCPIYIYTTCKL
jgi:hypothetical protein